MRDRIPEVLTQVLGRLPPLLFHALDALARMPDFIEESLDSLNEIGIHLLAVMQEPRPLLRLRHIRTVQGTGQCPAEKPRLARSLRKMGRTLTCPLSRQGKS